MHFEIRDTVQPYEFPPGFPVWLARQDVRKNRFLAFKLGRSNAKSQLNEDTTLSHNHARATPSHTHTNTTLLYTRLFHTTLFYPYNLVTYNSFTRNAFTHAQKFHTQLCHTHTHTALSHNPFSTIPSTPPNFRSHVHICFVLIGRNWHVGLSGL